MLLDLTWHLAVAEVTTARQTRCRLVWSDIGVGYGCHTRKTASPLRLKLSILTSRHS